MHFKPDVVFFRGQNSKYELKPSLWRKCGDDTISRIENRLYCDTFVIVPESYNYKSSWEVLAMMQHFGIPTRLLDWTSSLGNALFFAIENCLACKKKCQYCKCRPAIWLLSPHKMHEEFYPETLGSQVAVTIGVDDFKDYKECFINTNAIVDNFPDKGGEELKDNKRKWGWERPIFLEIPWRNLRIKSQKGFFTFHEKSTPLDKYDGHKKFLSKIQLSAQDVAEAKALIKLLDISAFDMYSDLPSLSQYLIRKHCP